jgi:transcription elongation factor Elf1
MTHRKVKEIETCPECGNWISQIRVDSNLYAWAVCDECETDTELEFAEPYVYEKHHSQPKEAK